MNRLTEYQRELVELHMNVIDSVIKGRIKVRGCALLSYEDFYQIGCEALCRAAMAYRPVLGEFEPLAATFIYNAILDQCRKQNKAIDNEMTELAAEESSSLFSTFASNDDVEQAAIDSIYLHVLDDYRDRYSGVAQLGVEAIRLKALGLGTREIADQYGTTVNNVNAWISKARAKLKEEPELMATLA